MENNENNAVIGDLTKEFENTIPNDEDKQELKQAFEKYLYEYKKVLEKSNINSLDDALKFSANKIMKLPLYNKKQKLIEDESFKEIQKISSKAFELAKNVVTGKREEIDNNSLEEMKNKLKICLNDVREFNKQQASMLVSEGILDLVFVENPKTQLISIRLGKNAIRKNNNMN